MLQIARVVKVHPGKRRMDCVDIVTGAPYPGVSILSGAMSSDTGLWAVPSVPRPSSEAAARGSQDTGRVMLACLMPSHGGRLVAIGFIQPPDSTGALTEEDDDALYRHPAGTTIRIAPDGTTTVTLPGGVIHTLGIDGKVHTVAPVSVTLETPLVKATEDVEIGGELRVKKDIRTEADTITSGKSFLQHRHQETQGVTDPPL